MSIFIFLAYGTFIYDWVLEPWAFGMLGSLYYLIIIIYILLDVVSLIIAMKFARKLDKKKILLIVTFITGLLALIASISGIYVFITLYVIIELLSGFFLITMTTLLFFAELLVNTPKPNKATDDLYNGIVETSKNWYYTKWGEIEKT